MPRGKKRNYLRYAASTSDAPQGVSDEVQTLEHNTIDDEETSDDLNGTVDVEAGDENVFELGYSDYLPPNRGQAMPEPTYLLRSSHQPPAMELDAVDPTPNDHHEYFNDFCNDLRRNHDDSIASVDLDIHTQQPAVQTAAEYDLDQVDPERDCDYFYDCVDSDDDDEATNLGNGKQQDRDDPLYDGAEVSFSESLVALLTFIMTHTLSKHCLSDLLALLKILLPRGNILVDTCHQFFSQFVGGSNPIVRHYYCRVCSEALVSHDALCERCGPGKGVNYFIQLPIINQLQNLFQRSEFLSNISHLNKRVKKSVNAYEDIYDGEIYKEAIRSLFGTDNWLTFMWNTDGFAIFNSFLFEVWPFYLAINELPPHLRYKKENMILAGLWFGVGKHFDPNLFLKPIQEELKTLRSGVHFFIPGSSQPVLCKAGLLCGTCDSPARSQFTCHVAFNGLYGCPKCLIRGEKSERTGHVFVYPYEENTQHRSDESEARHLNNVRVTGTTTFGIKGPTILSNMLLLSLLRSTAIDPMHNIFLGVMKSLMNLWFSETYKHSGFSLFSCKDAVNEYLMSVMPPHFLQRCPQPLSKLAFWKASEFQSFFFFYSLPLLRSVMYQVCFNHFKLLYMGVCLLYQDSVSEADILLSKMYLHDFVRQYQQIYGIRHMTFNLHILMHLPDVVKELGPLWTSSCFAFEDLNGSLKHLVHGTQYVGIQVQTNFDLCTRLPTLIKGISEGALKQLCKKMNSPSSRNKTSHCIRENVFFVGSMSKNPALRPNVLQVIHNSINGNLVFFQRLQMSNYLFEVVARKGLKKDSSIVSYKCNGYVYHGLLLNFIKVSQCNCMNVCGCPGEYYAVLQRFNSEIAFHTGLENSPIPFILMCTESQEMDLISIFDMNCVSAGVKAEDKLYVIDPITKHLFQ